MIGDITTTASKVARWTDLGVKLPKPLAGAIDTYEALKYVEVGYPVEFDLSAVTVANAEDMLRDYAVRLIPSLSLIDGRTSALHEAKRRSLEAAARQIIAAARPAATEIVNLLTPGFDKAATEFAEAVQALPNDLSADSLVQAGPAALTEYHRAGEAQGEIAKLDGWVASLRDIPGLAAEHPVELRILRPQTGGQLDALRQARELRRRELALFGQLNPMWVTAARKGIEFGLNLPRQAAEIETRVPGAGSCQLIGLTEPQPRPWPPSSGDGAPAFQGEPCPTPHDCSHDACKEQTPSPRPWTATRRTARSSNDWKIAESSTAPSRRRTLG